MPDRHDSVPDRHDSSPFGSLVSGWVLQLQTPKKIEEEQEQRYNDNGLRVDETVGCGRRASRNGTSTENKSGQGLEAPNVYVKRPVGTSEHPVWCPSLVQFRTWIRCSTHLIP